MLLLLLSARCRSGFVICKGRGRGGKAASKQAINHPSPVCYVVRAARHKEADIKTDKQTNKQTEAFGFKVFSSFFSRASVLVWLVIWNGARRC